VRRLVLVRHAESIGNAEGRVQGQSGTGLTSRGRAQARALAAALATETAGARLVSSDQARARETAEAIAIALQVTVEVDVRLRERAFGSWETRNHDEIAREDPDRWRRWRAGEDVIPELGGESSPQISARASEAFRDLISATPADGITIAVTHGGTIWRGVHALLSLPSPTLGPVDNASVALVLDPRGALPGGGGLRLARWNEVGHLPAELRIGAPWRGELATTPGR
jgi:glucosyl-3-phosphoglycerate phosphatase